MNTILPELNSPKVAVLLATYNGAANLNEQLESFVVQTQTPDLILVSDDGSEDNTREIVEAFRASHPGLQVEWLEGPQRGAGYNFLSLIQKVPDWIDVVAFSDQDDVWLPEKTERGVAALQSPDTSVPILFCGATWVCGEDLKDRKLSVRRMTPSFQHALAQNIAGGNTMMINKAAIDLLKDASNEPEKLVVHDWWIYQMVTAVGGKVIYDIQPSLLYRQHEGNVIGANSGYRARIFRMKFFLGGRYREWNDTNIEALRASAHRFTAENQRVLETFAQNRNANIFKRLTLIARKGVCRQGIGGQVSLYFAAVFKLL